jgi:uncharacterized protein YbcC (UPF0753/DUF2309 family)
MSDEFMFLPVSLLKQQTITELRKCNEYTAKYGLQLSEQEIGALVENRKEALESNGRIEFGSGVIQKIILEFADSPFIYQDNYANTIADLQDCFYYFKNESMEDMTDDELLKLMKKYFDDECQGSVEYLQSAILENFCRDVRYGSKDYRYTTGYEDNYIDFYDDNYEE